MTHASARIALVTGANKGLGFEVARQIGKTGAVILVGARNAVLGDAASAMLRAEGVDARFVHIDLSDPATITDAAKAIDRDHGRLDVLVNNAGLIRRADARDFKDDDWDTVLEVDLSSVFCLSRDAGRHMLDRGSGKIINIASVLSFQGGIRVPAYAAAKGAVAQLTKALANEWAGRGVNVNAIAPGYIRTDNTRALQDDEARSRQIQDRIPAGRWGEPEDLGGAVVFLASPASDYVHGHVLVVDGGWMGR
jgi:2-deoxy-D-gluconate 3-dehydrogenase